MEDMNLQNKERYYFTSSQFCKFIISIKHVKTDVLLHSNLRKLTPFQNMNGSLAQI